MKKQLAKSEDLSVWLAAVPLDSTARSRVDGWLPNHLSHAVSKRQEQSLAARWCAWQAAQDLGVELTSLPADEKGIPCWPSGLLGSLSHTDRWALGAVSTGLEFLSLGADVEELIAAEKVGELTRLIATENEIATRPVAMGQALWLTRVFCLKEAFYKAVYPFEKRFIDFQEVEVVFETSSLRWAQASGQKLYSHRFREWIYENYVASVVLIQE